MKINIYYGGRGIIDDPSLYVISKISQVLTELNVTVEQINLYEDKKAITALPATLKEADGIILSATVEWYGVGGLLMQFLDACWLYGDKDVIARTYMAPIVMSTTYGEREGMLTLTSAWEMLGGLPCEGLCGYIADTTALENNASYNKLIEKKAENIYRTINQRIPGLPASNQAVKKTVTQDRSAHLTPQETEQLSHYVSDEKFVRKQKEDIQELSSFFRSKMDMETPGKKNEGFSEDFEKHFHPVAGLHATYRITFSDRGADKSLVLDVDNKDLVCRPNDHDTEAVDVELTTDHATIAEIISGRMTFQRAFMAGNMKMKGDFKLLRNMDQLFVFREDGV